MLVILFEIKPTYVELKEDKPQHWKEKTNIQSQSQVSVVMW